MTQTFTSFRKVQAHLNAQEISEFDNTNVEAVLTAVEKMVWSAMPIRLKAHDVLTNKDKRRAVAEEVSMSISKVKEVLKSVVN
jgi:hypothetical protein